jgi:hypothetical protein
MNTSGAESVKEDWIPVKGETHYSYDLAENLVQARDLARQRQRYVLLIERLAFKTQGEARDTLFRLLDGSGKKRLYLAP